MRRCLLISLLILTGCASEPPRPVSITAQPAPKAALLNYALSLQGVPYSYGKADPQEGFDCSGFVQHVYAHAGINIPRTVKDMITRLPPVPKNHLQAGDLVFFNINGGVISHVGIYLNNAKFIHAPSQRSGKVSISNLNSDYWQQRFAQIRRP